MKSMVVLIDTNVALDLLTERQPFYHNARAVFQACASGEIEGYIAFHSLPNIFYTLRKVYSDEKRRAMLKRLCLVLRVTGASHDRVREAISREVFSDFEDCLQDECAQEVFADYIVTRNVDDFKCSRVKAITPEEFLQRTLS